MTTTAPQQLEAMMTAVRRELPALAGEMLTLSSQGFMEGGRFRELAAGLTEVPAEIRLNAVMAEINRAALEVVGSPDVPVRESHGLTALAKIEHAAKRRATRDYREAVLTEHECRAIIEHIDRISSAQSDGPAVAKRRIDPSWSLHDRVEFALRDAGFDYDEASRIAVLAANGASE